MQATSSLRGTAIAARQQRAANVGRRSLRVCAAKTADGPKLVIAGITWVFAALPGFCLLLAGAAPFPAAPGAHQSGIDVRQPMEGRSTRLSHAGLPPALPPPLAAAWADRVCCSRVCHTAWLCTSSDPAPTRGRGAVMLEVQCVPHAPLAL